MFKVVVSASKESVSLKMCEIEESVVTIKDSINNVGGNIVNKLEQLIYNSDIKTCIPIRIPNIKMEVDTQISSKEKVACLWWDLYMQGSNI